MSTLHISLSAIRENYKTLQKRLGGAECGAVVKANAYGLGVEKVAKALKKEGGKKFFVSNFEEAMELRTILPKDDIFVFHGVRKQDVKDCIALKVIPVINNANQLSNWPQDKPAALHVDTGMNRLGMDLEDINLADGYNLVMLMSHLACAEEKQNPMNYNQLLKFDKACKQFPYIHRSMANSYGIYLGKEFHFNITRPGIALYGGNPQPGQPNVMKNVVKVTAPIIQVNEMKKESTIGYGATYKAKKGQTIGTVEIGYADGIMRPLGNRAKCYVGGYPTNVIGRIAMDLITIDLTNLPLNCQRVGQEVEIVGEKYNISDMAKTINTIEYEVLTRLGNRLKRVYE